MPGYVDLTTARATTPDAPALLAALRALDASAGVVPLGPGLFRLKKNSPWLPAHISAAQTVIDTAPESSVTTRAQFTSREKDILTMCALIVRARGIPAWNALTVPQKVAATLAEADVWRDMRIWAEGNL